MFFFPLAAALVSLVFAALTAQSYFKKKKPHQLAWTLALVMFAIASLSAAIGVANGWSPFWFRTYFLFGAIVNVPVLALGTIYLLWPKRLGHALALLVAALSVFSAGVVFSADLKLSVLRAADGRIPRAHAVLPNQPILLARYLSTIAFIVIVGGALWSAWKLARTRNEYLGRIASANVLIAIGTFVVAAGSGAAGIPKLGRAGGVIFSVALLGGISLMFAGFLRTRLAVDPGSASPTSVDTQVEVPES
jgi:hypothetical protein